MDTCHNLCNISARNTSHQATLPRPFALAFQQCHLSNGFVGVPHPHALALLGLALFEVNHLAGQVLAGGQDDGVLFLECVTCERRDVWGVSVGVSVRL